MHSCKFSALFSPQPDSPLDHRFSTYQVNVMQSCDLCGSYIWGMERAYMCSGEFKKGVISVMKEQHNVLLYSTMHFCIFYFSLQINLSQKMSKQNHHRLLHTMRQEGNWHFEYSITIIFGRYNDIIVIWSPMSLFVCFYQDVNEPGSLHFGVHVSNLTSKATPVPKVLEMLLMHVEMNGLYSEGIYRKSGSTCRARELHQILETSKSLC